MTPELVLIFLITGALVFLVYLLIKYALNLNKSKNVVNETMDNLPYTSTFEDKVPIDLPPPIAAYEKKRRSVKSEPAPIREPVTEHEEMPEVPAHSKEELEEPEPLQQKVSQKVDEPSNFDKFEKNENQALFGSNLRHPEAMITNTSGYASLEQDVSAGVASQVNIKDTMGDMPYNAEMAQNGGEFMKGISAFDTSDKGNWFSNL